VINFLGLYIDWVFLGAMISYSKTCNSFVMSVRGILHFQNKKHISSTCQKTAC
jgi:hypothetical protein